MDGVDDLGVVNALQIDACDPEVGVPELALDDDQRHPLVGHLHSVGVAQLMGRQPAAHPGPDAGATQFSADGGGRPRAAAAGAVQHAEQRADRQLAAVLDPRLELLLIPTSE
jgi:hypothetical protein